MLYPSHLLFTGFLVSAFRDSLPQNAEFLFLAIALFSTLLPDLDNKESALGRFLPAVGLIMKHRGFLHTPTAAIAFWFPIRLLAGTTISTAFLLGYLSHLALDSLSKQGIAPLYPLSKRRIRGPILVGSRGETALTIAIVFALLATLL